MWRHQRAALDFATERRASLLHMGMATGKSRVALELAARDGARLTLVIGPLAVFNSTGWPRQARMYLPDAETLWLAGDGPDAKGVVAKRTERLVAAVERARAMAQPLVVGINYDAVWREPMASAAMRVPWDLVVLDESHRAKAPGGKASRYLYKLTRKARRVVALSGTPLPHSPLDIYAQFRALNPGIFGMSFVAFRNRYARMGGFQARQVVGYQNLDELRRKMAAITFQPTDVELELPDAMHETVLVKLGASGLRAYKQMERELVADVRGGQVTAANGLVRLLRLQQIAGGWLPDPLGQQGDAVQVDTSKQDALGELMDDLDEPLVVFAQFRGELDSVRLAAEARGWGSFELSGRAKELPAWREAAARGERVVLAAQIRAGGVGVEMTEARVVAYISTGFSLGDYEQSLARVRRPDQKARAVVYYHLIAAGTIDEIVMAAIGKRASLVDSTLAALASAAGAGNTGTHRAETCPAETIHQGAEGLAP